MADGIQSINSLSKYGLSSDELKKVDTDNDGSVSVFELQSAYPELENQDDLGSVSDETSAEDTESQIEALEEQLEEVEDKQGFLGKAWNGLKNLTGIGSSSEKCEQAIEDFKNGKISYEEASSTISGFESKQDNATGIIANVATGFAAVGVAASAVATGGLSLGVVAAAAGTGAAVKTGIKTAERATNNIEGDALDGKQIVKDAVTGAVDGAVSVATMGIGAASTGAKEVVEQTLKQSVIQGAKAGATQGAIAGAATGATEYTVDAALEDDVEFSVGGLLSKTAQTAAAGAVFGGVIGGVTGGIQNVKLNKEVNNSYNEYLNDVKADIAKGKNVKAISIEDFRKLNQRAYDLEAYATAHKAEFDEKYMSNFSDDPDKLNLVDNISSRGKGHISVRAKLVKKMTQGDIKNPESLSECQDVIGDLVGGRLTVKNLSAEDSERIIKNTIENNDFNLTVDDYLKYKKSGEKAPGFEYEQIDDALKEAQTNPIAERICELMKSKDAEFEIIDEFNNYAEDGTSYFTNNQLQNIADTYNEVTGKNLKFVTSKDRIAESGIEAIYDPAGGETGEYIVGKAIYKPEDSIKESGYPAAQFNFKVKYKDGTHCNAELQIRGEDVNVSAEGEHVIYDIISGKILPTDKKHGTDCSLINSLSDESKDELMACIRDVYGKGRALELGIKPGKVNFGSHKFTQSQNSGGKDVSEEVRAMLEHVFKDSAVT